MTAGDVGADWMKWLKERIRRRRGRAFRPTSAGMLAGEISCNG